MYESIQEQGIRSLIRRRWRTMGLTAAVVLVGGAAYLSSQPTRYEATAKLLVMRLDQRLGGLKAANEAIPTLTTSSRPLYTQVELLRSRPVLNDVAERLDLKDAQGDRLTADALAKSVKVVPIKDTDIIEVSVRGGSAVEARQIVAALCEAYQKRVADFRREGVREGLKLIDEQLETAQQRLAQAEDRLLKFKRGTGTVDLPEQVRRAVTEMADLDRVARSGRADYERARARSAGLSEKLGMPADVALAALAIEQNPRINALKSQLLAAETSPVLTQGLGPDHPDRQAAERQIERLQAALRSAIHAQVGRAGAAGPIDDVRRGLLRSLIEAQTEEQAIFAGLRSVDAARKLLEASVNRFPDLELSAVRLTRETEAASEVYRELLRKREEARVNLTIAPSYAQVIEPGAVPERPLAPLKGQAAPVLLLGALAAAFGAGGLREIFDRSIRPEELGSHLPDVRILATVPTLTRSQLRHGELVVGGGAALHYVEALRGLCLALEDEAPGGGDGAGRVVALTSATPGEGKSVTTANLALCLAEAGYRVLLVDGDRHRPRVHELFSTPPRSRGLWDVLQGKASPEEAITHAGTIDVVTAGTGSAGRIARPRPKVGPIIEAWRQQYDFILIDLPPMAMFAEVGDLARHAGAILLVAATKRISTDVLESAARQIRTIRTPLLGLVAITPSGYGPHKKYLESLEAEAAAEAQTRARSKAGAKTKGERA